MILNSEALSTHSPRVLVSGSFYSSYATPKLNDLLKTLADNALFQLSRAGVQGVIVNAANSSDSPQKLIEEFDGLLILGGGDIDPATYGQCIKNACSYGVNPAADSFEISLVQAAVQIRMPLIGICRGMQIMNIAHGGTLIQDVGANTLHNVMGDSTAMTEHSVKILPRTKLSNIFSCEHIDIRSAHHQAIEKIGDSLSVSAIAPDGVVEAIELNGDAWGVGLQWHPEDSHADAGHFEMLLQAFAHECSVYSGRRILRSEIGSS